MNDSERSMIDYTLDLARRRAVFKTFSVRDAIRALRLANAMLMDEGHRPLIGAPSMLTRLETETLERAISVVDYLSDTQQKRLLH